MFSKLQTKLKKSTYAQTRSPTTFRIGNGQLDSWPLLKSRQSSECGQFSGNLGGSH
jgi:hypothetical protein